MYASSSTRVASFFSFARMYSTSLRGVSVPVGLFGLLVDARVRVRLDHRLDVVYIVFPRWNFHDLFPMPRLAPLP